MGVCPSGVPALGKINIVVVVVVVVVVRIAFF